MPRLIRLVGADTQSPAAVREKIQHGVMICDRLATQGNLPFVCVPQGAPPRREKATVPEGEVRLVAPNGAVTGSDRQQESVVVIPALPNQ